MAPRQSKHKAILPAITTAEQAADWLRTHHQPALAEAVTGTAAYARHAAERLARGNDFTEGTPANHPIKVTREFRQHVHDAFTAAVEAGEISEHDAKAGVSGVVRKGLIDFLNGTWEPGEPPVVPGTKVVLNIRVPSERWDAADEDGKDPEAVTERGYKLTAAQISIAALRRRFGDPTLPPPPGRE